MYKRQVFICLAVWMDLKTPEYLSDITTLLAKEGTKVSDIMDPGIKMLLFSFGSFLMAVFVGFLASRVAASFTTVSYTHLTKKYPLTALLKRLYE